MVVETSLGRIRGCPQGGGLAFLGVPFARTERFRPPQNATPWAGVREANSIGATAMQAAPRNDLAMNEDCLNLNIWTPAADGQRRPVLFYIHGGGHYEGCNADPGIDGPHLLQGRQAVMVSANYRLGAFGYLHLGELLGADWALSGSCGLLDQLAALQWVRDNIAAFGGDPDNVTLMGQSAGGKSVGELLVRPQACGLFRRAIIQSGGFQCLHDRDTGDRVARLLLEALNLKPSQTAELLTLPAETLVAAQVKVAEQVAFWHAWGPVVDGTTLCEPEQAIPSLRGKDLTVLIGHTREENTTRDEDATFDESTVPALLRWHYGANADYLAREVYPRYRASSPANVALSRLVTDYSYGHATLRAARLLTQAGVNTWLYRWDLADRTTAHHSSDMPYVFGIGEAEQPTGYPPRYRDFAQSINGAWVNFLLHGDPQADGLPDWPRCQPQAPLRMLFDRESRVEPVDLGDEDLRFPTQVFRL